MSEYRAFVESGWQAVTNVLKKHYMNPDTEAARILCAALASHALKGFSPAWCLAIAPPGSMKTDFLESFRGLPGVHFVDEVTTNTFLSGKVDEKGKKRTKPASWLHRIGSDGVLVAADFSTFTSNPKTLQVILAQLRRIYDGNFSREFGTDENIDERSWRGRVTLFAGAVPDIDGHYSLFQKLGERFVRVRWPRAGGVETGLQAMEHTKDVPEELRVAVRSLILPILSTPQTAPAIPEAIKRKIANLSEFVALARTYIERDGYSREASGVPVTEGNTRLPQQLCQIARGSALLEGRSTVNEDDYRLVCRVAFDSVPPDRIAVLKAILECKSPFTLGLPKATAARAIEDLRLSGVLTEQSAISATAMRLLVEAGLEQDAGEPPNSNKSEVPESTDRYRNEISSTVSPISGTQKAVPFAIERLEVPERLTGTRQRLPADERLAASKRSMGERCAMKDQINETSGEITQKREMNPASLANLRPFAPGNSANPGGRPRTKLFRRRLLRQLLAPEGEVQRVDRVVENQIDLAASKGKNAVSAFVAIRDSVDGRPETSDTIAQAGLQVVIQLGAHAPAGLAEELEK